MNEQTIISYLKASREFEVPKGTIERYAMSDEEPNDLINLPNERKTVLYTQLENQISTAFFLKDPKLSMPSLQCAFKVL